MKRQLLVLSLLGSSLAAYAQPLTTVTGLKLYEHHSSSINGGAPFGSSANGTQSGYDFVARKYFSSFNPQNFGAYTAGEEANIDMVEHNGGFGNGGPFGFTSGVSTIWGGDIKGNSTTKWMEAPASFNYSTATNVSAIRSAYDSTVATLSVAAVAVNKTYLARIRNSNLYVAIRVTEVKNAAGMGGVQDVYFTFDYKYGTYSAPPPTGIGDAEIKAGVACYPNPATDAVHFENKLSQKVTLTLVTIYGQRLKSSIVAANSTGSLDLSALSKGLYLLQLTSADGRSYTQQLIKQ